MPGSLKNSSSVKNPHFLPQKMKMPGINFRFDRKMCPSMESQPLDEFLVSFQPPKNPDLDHLGHFFPSHKRNDALSAFP